MKHEIVLSSPYTCSHMCMHTCVHTYHHHITSHTRRRDKFPLLETPIWPRSEAVSGKASLEPQWVLLASSRGWRDFRTSYGAQNSSLHLLLQSISWHHKKCQGTETRLTIKNSKILIQLRGWRDGQWREPRLLRLLQHEYALT